VFKQIDSKNIVNRKVLPKNLKFLKLKGKSSVKYLHYGKCPWENHKNQPKPLPLWWCGYEFKFTLSGKDKSR